MTFSLIVPSLGHRDLLSCLLESVARYSSQQWEICIGVDPEAKDWLEGFGERWPFPIKIGTALKPGMHEAIQMGFVQSTGEWIAMLHEDMVCLPHWDEFPALDPHYILCFEQLERMLGTWLPFVDAGCCPEQYHPGEARIEAERRWAANTSDIQFGGPFFGTALMHRASWVPWPSWSGTKYRTHDTAWLLRLHTANPDAIFGWMPGRCVYHFVSGAVRRKTDIQPDDPNEFQTRYGMTTQEAEKMVFEDSRRKATNVSG